MTPAPEHREKIQNALQILRHAIGAVPLAYEVDKDTAHDHLDQLQGLLAEHGLAQCTCGDPPNPHEPGDGGCQCG